MRKEIFAICDPDKDYAENFAGYMIQRKMLPFNITAFTTTRSLLEFGNGKKIDLLLISPELLTREVKELSFGTLVLLSLSAVGFVEGEGAIQPEGVADGVWALFCLFPALGFAIALVILLAFYKLRTADVQVMSKFNNGQITKEEAEAVLADKYGPAGDR